MALRMLVAAATTVVAAAATVAVAVPAAADPAIAGTYNPVVPTRVLDTRSGVGAPKAALGSGKTLTFAATHGLGTQAVSAVALTITISSPPDEGGSTFSMDVSFTLTSSEPATICWSLDAGSLTCSAAGATTFAANLSGLAAGSHQLMAITTDSANNWVSNVRHWTNEP